jgi:DNA recombinase
VGLFMRYGYIRVSTKEQNIDRQLTALSLENISKEQIFIDRASGKNFNRIEYQRLLTILQEDDDLVIKSIDRLGRNYDDILEQWKLLTKVKKVHLVVLDFPLLNTRNNIDTITGKLISDLVLQVLSYVSQMEREQIKQRQMEGIHEAKKRGKRFGRPQIKIPDEFLVAVESYKRNMLTIREGAKLFGVSKSTFHNWLKRVEKS